jgi:hypothetical protein
MTAPLLSNAESRGSCGGDYTKESLKILVSFALSCADDETYFSHYYSQGADGKTQTFPWLHPEAASNESDQ